VPQIIDDESFQGLTNNKSRVNCNRTAIMSASKYGEKRQSCLNYFKQCLTQSEKDGWKVFKTKVPEVRAWKLSTTNVPCVKCVCEIAISPTKLYKLVWEQTVESKKQYDEDLLEDNVVESIDNDTQIRYVSSKAPVVTNRDFCIMKACVREGDVIYHFNVSVEHDKVPQKKGFVRGNMIILGYAYAPTPGKPGSTTVTHIAQIDPAGKIPNWLVTLNCSKIPERMTLLRRLVEQSRETNGS